MLTFGSLCQGEVPSVRGYFITPKEPSRSLLSLISRRKALSKQQLADQSRKASPESELTCFANFVAGSGSLQATMQRTRALPFRCSPLMWPYPHALSSSLWCGNGGNISLERLGRSACRRAVGLTAGCLEGSSATLRTLSWHAYVMYMAVTPVS